MSFLGGVRWADLSSDTQSLSAAPPFCPGLEDEAATPFLLRTGTSVQQSTCLGPTRKKRGGTKDAPDTAEALLLQCDAAAEQSYLNPPSCTADFGRSTGGVNLHFRQAARLGCATPVEDDMGEAGSPLAPSLPREHAAGDASPDVYADLCPVASAAEQAQGHRSSGGRQRLQRQEVSTGQNWRGGGSARGRASFVSAGFKGILASTNNLGGGSDGPGPTVKKNGGNFDNTVRNTDGNCADVSRQPSATNASKKLRRKLHGSTDSQRSAGMSGSSVRKKGGENIHIGDRQRGMPFSLFSAPPVETRQQPRRLCQGQEGDSPGGRRRYGEASKGSARGRDAAKPDQGLAATVSKEKKAAERRTDSGPDKSENWRSAFTTKERGNQRATTLPEEPAFQVPSRAAARPSACKVEPTVDQRPGEAASSRRESYGVQNEPPPQLQQAPLSSEASAPEGLAQQQPQQQQPQASSEVRMQQSSECAEQQQQALASEGLSVRKSGRSRGPRFAARMMTPAKRHRVPIEGDEGGATLPECGEKSSSAKEFAAVTVGENIEAYTGNVEEVDVTHEKKGSGSPSLTARVHCTPALAVGERTMLPAARDCAPDAAANVDTAETSAFVCQLHVLQGPPPLKKKRGAAENSKRLAAEKTVTLSQAPFHSKHGVAADSGAGQAAANFMSRPRSSASSEDMNVVYGEQQQRRGKMDSLLNGGAVTGGRRRSKAGGSGKSGEEPMAPNGVFGLSGELIKNIESAAAAATASPNLLQFAAAQAYPLLQMPGACFATPPYIMVPVAAATPLATTRRNSGSSVFVPAATNAPVGATAPGRSAMRKEVTQNCKPRLASGVSSVGQINALAFQQDDEGTEEQWARRASSRMKDIAVGKATEGYRNFIRTIPKDRRRAGDPTTPDPKQRCSKAKFQRELLDWKKQLHRYDGCGPPQELHTLLDISCSSGGGAPGGSHSGNVRSHATGNDGDHLSQSSCSSSTSKMGSFVATQLFFTPTTSEENAVGCKAEREVHPDPIEEFNRECERAWL